MIITTAAQYAAAEAALLSLGFTNVPHVSEIDFTQANPVTITANVQFKFTSVSSKNVVLAP